MSPRQTRLAFVAAGLAVCGAAIAVSMAGDRASERSQRPGADASARRPLVRVQDRAASRPASEPVASDTAPRPTPARRAAAEDSPAAGQPQRMPAPARQTARRFVTALLEAETGTRRPRVMRNLAATGSPGLVAGLLADRPRAIAGIRPQAGSLAALEPVEVAARGDRGRLVATVRRGRRTSALLVTVERRAGRWRVIDLG